MGSILHIISILYMTVTSLVVAVAPRTGKIIKNVLIFMFLMEENI